MKYRVIVEVSTGYYIARADDGQLYLTPVRKEALKFYFFNFVSRYGFMRKVKEQYPDFEFKFRMFVPMKAQLTATNNLVDRAKGNENDN